MDLQHLILLALKLSIIATVFGFGLNATIDDVLYVVRHPSRLLRSLIAMFVVMPVLAYGLDRAFEFRPEIEVVLLALALSPVPPLLPRKQDKAGGRASYGLGLMVTTALLSIAIVPLGVALMGRLFHQSATAPASVATLIFANAILPLLAGMAVGALLKGTAQRIVKPVRLIANLLLVVIGLAILAQSYQAIARLVGDATLIALAVFTVVGLAAGHWLGGPVPQDRTVLALSTASRHPGIALAIAAANHPDAQAVTAAILLYLLVSLALSIPYVAWRRRVDAATAI